MNKIIFSSVIFFCLSLNIFGQSREIRGFDNGGVTFADRLWYGGAFNLGFSSFNGINQFLLGISPQVGYKITPPFSVGPRASLQYSYFSANGENASPLTWSVGVFTRHKLFWQIFAQLEYEYEDEAFVSFGIGRPDLVVSRVQNNNVFIGGGYNSSEGLKAVGYEILFLYNVTEEPIGFDQRGQFRFGFTYNF